MYVGADRRFKVKLVVRGGGVLSHFHFLYSIAPGASSAHTREEDTIIIIAGTYPPSVSTPPPEGMISLKCLIVAYTKRFQIPEG